MAYPPSRLLLVSMLSALAMACGHKIGDECTTSVDCSQGGERLCDITQPGGYCTVFNCEPDTCPEESACIAFGAALSTAPGCADPSGLSRLHRPFCMLTCSSNSDCRGGYTCVDLNDPLNSWRNALPIDRDRSSKVCLASFTDAPTKLDNENGVCTGPGTDSAGTGGASTGGASTGGASTGGASGTSGGEGGSDASSSGGAGGSGG